MAFCRFILRGYVKLLCMIKVLVSDFESHMIFKQELLLEIEINRT